MISNFLRYSEDIFKLFSLSPFPSLYIPHLYTPPPCWKLHNLCKSFNHLQKWKSLGGLISFCQDEWQKTTLMSCLVKLEWLAFACVRIFLVSKISACFEWMYWLLIIHEAQDFAKLTISWVGYQIFGVLTWQPVLWIVTRWLQSHILMLQYLLPCDLRRI